MNYIGPRGVTTEGIYIYYNGNKLAEDTTISSASLPAGNGRVVVGRHLPEEGKDYAGVEVDELLLFNSNLNEDDVNTIYTI